jgi:phosphoribosyl 1,2-cyclic phosphodiesterase
MRFNVLASGSSGNATLISTGQTSVLVDCGLSARELGKRLEAVGSSIDKLDAIVITHEHSDHIRGLKTLAKKPGIRIYISPVALTASILKNDQHLNLGEPLKAEQPFEIGDLTFSPIKTPHDSVDPLVFKIESRGVKMAIVTDLGYIPKSVAYQLKGCDALVLEANHEIDMLRVSAYPWATKQRILSQVGHLSNKEMARFLREDFDGKAQHLVLAHLSQQNNHPEIARLAALEALEAQTPLFAMLNEQKVQLAKADSPLGWIDL